MFKSGSKFLYGLAAFGFVGAIAYAAVTNGHKVLSMDSLLGPITLGYKGYVGDHLGFAVLVGLAATALALAILVSALGDVDAEAQAHAVGMETVPEVPAPAKPNYWPAVTAFSAAAVAVGLATGSELVALGLIGLAICAVEWAARAWADRATGDPDVNQDIRDRVMRPVEIPVGAILAVALMVGLVSRILLAVPHFGIYIVFGLVPLLIFVFGALIVLRNLSPSVVAGVALVAALLVLVGGAIAAIHGPQKTEKKTEGAAAVHSASVPAPATIVIRVAD